MSSVSSAAASEVAAVIQSTVEPSKATIRVPAAAGPTMITSAEMLSRMPISRSAVSPECRTIAGSIASRAVMPGTSPNAPMMPNRMNQPRSRPVIRSTIGRAAIDAAEMRSDTIDEVRRLMRSITTPANRPARKAGSAVEATSTPVESRLPVICSTISGKTTAAIELPSSDRAYEARYSTGTGLMLLLKTMTLRRGQVSSRRPAAT